MGYGEDEERGQNLGTLYEDDGNGSHDMEMRTDEGSEGEVIGEKGGEDTMLDVQAT